MEEIIKKVLEQTSNFTGIKQEDILSNKKGKGHVISVARLMFYMACNIKGISYYSLSRYLGKERTTVINAVNQNKLVYTHFNFKKYKIFINAINSN